ncbi:MAG: N-acetyltransferase [Clostridia bacterium]|nr:N-acetyltransferase [Clostridia bacterium]
MNIRKFETKDSENLRKICHETATAKEYVENKELVCTLFCDYYFQIEPENIFVAADDNDEAQGYVLCALDYKNFFEIFNQYYLPKVRNLSKKQALFCRFEPLVYRKIAKEYPAHLHIDLLSVCQGQGIGGKLISSLCAYLTERGIDGLCLTVGADNKRAIKFYEKLGFEKIKSIFGKAFVYGKKLN